MSRRTEKDTVRQAFAERFRKALEDLGLSISEQSRLRRLFGVSGQAVRKWLEGTSMPTAARMPLVAEALGVRRAWLQDGEGPMRLGIGEAQDPVTGGCSLRLSDYEVRLLVRLRLLGEEERNAIDCIVRAMIDKNDPQR